MYVLVKKSNKINIKPHLLLLNPDSFRETSKMSFQTAGKINP